MRNMVWMVTVLAFGPSVGLAQSNDWANKLLNDKPMPSVHDFGSVPWGAKLYHRFPMKNIWAVRVEIMEVRVSCGCVTATPSTRVLEPRESGFLDVTMDARRFTGPKTVTVYVKIGPQYTSTAMLQLSANSRRDVVFNPGQVNFGVVPRGETPVQTIDVEYAGVLDWRVSDIIKNSAPLDVALEELYRRPGQQVGYRIRVTVQKNAPPGPLRHELLLKTNDPASPLVPVLVEATIKAPLNVSPNPVRFEPVAVGATASMRVIVHGSKPFKILAVDGLGDGVQANLPTASALIQVINLQYLPSQAGDLKRQLQITTDLDGQPPATVTVEGTATP